MTFLPGKRSPGIFGAHWRELEADVLRLREAYGVDMLLLLVEDHELERARVSNLAAAMTEHGIDLVRHPITDGGVPIDADAFRATLTDVERRLAAGESVAVACMGGLGRTGTAVACLLRDHGLDADTAITLTREARPGTLENTDQEDFVGRWRRP